MRDGLLLSIVCLLLPVGAVFQSCDMVEYHPYDGRVVTGATNINARNIEKIERACAGKSVIRFALISDTQRWYDETDDFVTALNRRNDVDFVIHAGDISDFGATKEFVWIRDIMEKLKIPYVALLGNHDCHGSGMFVYRKIFGNLNFSFIAGRTKFLCLNTVALEFDYSTPVPDLNFMSEALSEHADDYGKTVVVMHAPPYSEQFNNNVALPFQETIKQFPLLQFCLYGHIHEITANDLFDDGIMYYSVSSIEKRQYMIFTLTQNDEYYYEVADF
jgi:Icc-related predicted phosphoesterase